MKGFLEECLMEKMERVRGRLANEGCVRIEEKVWVREVAEVVVGNVSMIESGDVDRRLERIVLSDSGLRARRATARLGEC
jgi:hypothetical protein